jgi:hypothetical protein
LEAVGVLHAGAQVFAVRIEKCDVKVVSQEIAGRDFACGIAGEAFGDRFGSVFER